MASVPTLLVQTVLRLYDALQAADVDVLYRKMRRFVGKDAPSEAELTRSVDGWLQTPQIDALCAWLDENWPARKGGACILLPEWWTADGDNASASARHIATSMLKNSDKNNQNVEQFVIFFHHADHYLYAVVDVARGTATAYDSLTGTSRANKVTQFLVRDVLPLVSERADGRKLLRDRAPDEFTRRSVTLRSQTDASNCAFYALLGAYYYVRSGGSRDNGAVWRRSLTPDQVLLWRQLDQKLTPHIAPHSHVALSQAAQTGGTKDGAVIDLTTPDASSSSSLSDHE